jgi:hypothetical protein
MKMQQSDGSWKFDPKLGDMFNLNTTKLVGTLPNPNVCFFGALSCLTSYTSRLQQNGALLS